MCLKLVRLTEMCKSCEFLQSFGHVMAVRTGRGTEPTRWSGAPGGTLSLLETLSAPSPTASACGGVASALCGHPVHQGL